MANNDDFFEEDEVARFEAEGAPAEPVVETETAPEPEPEPDLVEVKYVRGGTYNDVETGLKFRRGAPVEVDYDTAERLLSTRRGGAPVFVRTS